MYLREFRIGWEKILAAALGLGFGLSISWPLQVSVCRRLAT